MHWQIKGLSGRLIAPIVPLVSLVMLFCLLAVVSVWWTARAADRLDRQRMHVSIDAAIQSQIGQIAALAYDNGYSDDAAAKLAVRPVDRVFTRQAWGAGTEQGIIYDLVFAFDEGRNILFAYEKGQPTGVNYLGDFAPAVDDMATDLASNRNGAAGLAKTNEGLWIVGIANVMASSADMKNRPSGKGQVRLVLARRLSNPLLAEIGKGLQIKNLRLGSGRPGNERIEMRDPAGRLLGHISWIPNNPGVESLWKAVPLLAAGLLLCIVISGFLIRGRQTVHAELERQAMIDSLSQLPNRRAMHTRAKLWLSRREQLSLALLDLDGFKTINDNYGHEVGDQLIKECAVLLNTIAGQSASVARLGGDEFAILLYGPDSANRLEAIASQFLWRLDQPFKIGERTVTIGASIGLAATLDEIMDAQELMRRADIAMYAAKRAGKMRIVWFDAELGAAQADSHRIELELRTSLENEDFETVYQPIYNAKGKLPVAVEALVRWTSPTTGPLGPDVFVPIAEETGLIDRIGCLVLRRACADALLWPGIKLSVNISAAQLRNPEFPARVAEILAETGFPSEMLELEITETALIVDPRAVGKVLIGLRALGIKIALDDFGTGYASIGILRQFRFDKLKLDRSLVIGASDDETARILLQASVTLARGLNMTVVAEGVETDAQADLMRVAGCDELQGWHLSYPVAANEISAMLGYQSRAAANRA